MKIQYVAEDGTIFNSQTVCETYERLVAFGGDPCFTDTVYEILSPLVHHSDGGYTAIAFSGRNDYTKVAVALAQNFEKLTEVYKCVETELAHKRKLKAEE